MAFKKGEPRPANAGRKKGSLNRKTIARVADVLAEKDINPTEKILELIQKGHLEPRDEVKAWLELLSYTQAKPKPTEEGDENSGPSDRPLTPEDILDIVDVTPKEIEKK